MKVLLPLPSLSSANAVMSSDMGKKGPNRYGILLFVFLDGRTLINKYKERDVCDMIFLHNKEASWDRKLNSYVLNFQGRANQVKHNFLGDMICFI